MVVFSAAIGLSETLRPVRGNDKGKGLRISRWTGNDEASATDYVNGLHNFVTDSIDKRLGTKTGHVHTHPGKSTRPGLGYGSPSDADKLAGTQGVKKNYPYFINSKYDGWVEY